MTLKGLYLTPDFLLCFSLPLVCDRVISLETSDILTMICYFITQRVQKVCGQAWHGLKSLQAMSKNKYFVL